MQLEVIAASPATTPQDAPTAAGHDAYFQQAIEQILALAEE